MALRITQAVVEVLLEGDPSARVTQVVVEAMVQPPSPIAIVTQAVCEVLITRPTTDEACAASWVMPTPNPYPTFSNGGPLPIYFDEMEPDFNEFGKQFADGRPVFNTIQTTHVRRFVFEYDGLDQDEAAILDDHWDSTRGALSFTLIHPRTAEVITGVRYEDYSRSPHQRVWSQTRSVKLVKYPG